jgi:NitT/TauT family transport system permease protein
MTERVFGKARLGAAVGRYRVSIIAALVFFACWELFIRLLDIPLYILPPPSRIVYELFRNLPLILKYTLVTAFESFTGFALSAIVGVPLSMLIAFSLFLKRTIYPGTVALQLVPKIALAPLFVTWFGFGIEPKIIIVFLLCFFPILLNGILGFTSLSTELGYFGLSTGSDPMTVFRKIRLPAALPQVFVGLKWAAVNATVGATIGEWIGGDAGLGYYIQIATGDLRMDLAFAIILVLAALGLLLFYLVLLAERKTVPWHVSQRKEEGTARF